MTIENWKKHTTVLVTLALPLFDIIGCDLKFAALAKQLEIGRDLDQLGWCHRIQFLSGGTRYRGLRLRSSAPKHDLSPPPAVFLVQGWKERVAGRFVVWEFGFGRVFCFMCFHGILEMFDMRFLCLSVRGTTGGVARVGFW